MTWARSDVEEGKNYALYLCQSSDGERFYRLAELDAPPAGGKGAGVFFTTQQVPHDLLKRRDVIGIAESVKLESGERYYVDAHGVWLTEDELSQLRARRDFATIRWSTGVPPKFNDR